MKKRGVDGKKIGGELDLLQARLATASAESERVTATRRETRRKLDELGKQLARLKAEFESLAQEKARTQK